MDGLSIDQCSDVFAMQNTSPHSLRQVSSPQTPTEMHYDDILASATEYTPSQHIINDSEEDYVTEDDLLSQEPTASGRTSISSFPSSVVHHNIPLGERFLQDGLRIPSHSRRGTPTSHSYNPESLLSTRDHLTGFRNPSSVRALQMRDEFSDGEDFTPGHRRRGSRMSYMSYRSGSAYSTPGKRMSRSLQGSPTKSTSKLRKEFPLVLLHCSILPSIISPKVKAVNEELLEAIIPEPYKKRWKLLQEKVMRNFEVRERGVLIAHPKEDYDVLEERLLESLELERPVLLNGHFIGRSESRASVADSGFGSEESSDREDTNEPEEEHKCADCGGQMCQEKRWEVKVFAANGLMRAGAWSAAWSEMEKVDVQVSVWLPEDVRQEVEARLDAVIAQEQELQEEDVQGDPDESHDERTREIYGENAPQRRQEEIDGLSDASPPPPPPDPTNHERVQSTVTNTHTSQTVPAKVDLHVAFARYVQLLLQDRRNIAILLLSILLLSYGTASSPKSTNNAIEPVIQNLQETKFEYLTTTVVSTSTTVAIQTSIVTEAVQTTTESVPISSALLPSARSLGEEGVDDLSANAPLSMVRKDLEAPDSLVLESSVSVEDTLEELLPVDNQTLHFEDETTTPDEVDGIVGELDQSVKDEL